MGILSFMRKKHNQVRDPENPEDFNAAPSAARTAEKPKAGLPNLRRGMSVEILGKDGQVIANGLITECSGRGLTVDRHPGGLSFPVCETGSSIVVHGLDSEMRQFYLRAVVDESSRVHIRLKGLVQEVRDDLRDSFRLAVNIPITMFYFDDRQMQLPMECTLVDISADGCCISSEHLYKAGDVLRFKVKLESYAQMNLVGEVIRVTERGHNDYSYGILFAQLDKGEHNVLTRTLLNIHTGNYREHSRINGHW